MGYQDKSVRHRSTGLPKDNWLAGIAKDMLCHAKIGNYEVVLELNAEFDRCYNRYIAPQEQKILLGRVRESCLIQAHAGTDTIFGSVYNYYAQKTSDNSALITDACEAMNRFYLLRNSSNP